MFIASISDLYSLSITGAAYIFIFLSPLSGRLTATHGKRPTQRAMNRTRGKLRLDTLSFCTRVAASLDAACNNFLVVVQKRTLDHFKITTTVKSLEPWPAGRVHVLVHGPQVFWLSLWYVRVPSRRFLAGAAASRHEHG